MRIAIVVWELDITGGTQRLALELSRNLVKRGHVVDVYAYYHAPRKGYVDLMTPLSMRGVTGDRESMPPPITQEIGKIGYFYRIYRKIIVAFWQIDPKVRDLAHLVKSGGRYDVINIHDYSAYRIAPLIQNTRIVWTMNDIQRPPLSGKNPFHNGLFNLIQQALIRREIRNIRTIAVLDERNRRLVRDYYGRDSTVVRGGMDLDMFDGQSPIRVARARYQVFVSSIFFPHRRFEDVVDAAKILRNRGREDFHVQINGITDRALAYYESIRKRIADAALEPFFTITPGLSEEALKKAYLAADLFVFPNDNQTWGLAVFEAMLAGCPTIVSKGSGASEILADGENALLVPPRDPESIANALDRIMNDKELRARLSENGPAFVRSRISWTRYAEEMERLFI